MGFIKSQFKLLPPRGFTIIEMLVSVTIIAIITVVVVVNFRAGRHRDELRAGAMLIVSLIQQAQTYALAGNTIDYGGNPAGPPGWGVSINPQDDKIIFFADGPIDKDNWYGDGVYTEDDKNWFFEEFTLAEYNVSIDDSTTGSPPAFCVKPSNMPDACDESVYTADYVFSLPLANRHINDDYQYPNRGSISLIIRHNVQTDTAIRLTANASTGQVVLGPIEIIPE